MGSMLAMFTAAGVQTYRDLKLYHRAPVPQEFTSTLLLFGGLGILDSATSSNLGSWIAWGLIAAVVLQAGGPAGLVKNGVPDPLGPYFNGPQGKGALAQAPGKGRGTGALVGPGRGFQTK